MFDTVCKMPVSQNRMPNTKQQKNEINLSNNKHFDNNNLFATNNHGINMQDNYNNNFNNNSQPLSNKRRINEGFINNDCNNQLNKKFKHEELVIEGKNNGVCVFIAYFWALKYY